MIEFIRRYPALLFFGLLSAAFSAPGQTFLVSLFIPPMREAFGLSKTQIAGIYSAATLLSAFFLPMMGKALDRLHLKWFTLVCGIFLSLGCFVLASSRGIVTLFLGFLLVRNLGQGTLTLISSTTMARIFQHFRGKALGISNLGYPISEMLFPSFLAFWILREGWRAGWTAAGIAVLILFLPAVLFLLHQDRHLTVQKSIESRFEKESRSLRIHPEAESWTVRRMLKDWRFYVLLYPVLIPPAFFTAIFFHHVSLFELKHWGLSLISLGFIGYGICRASVSFLSGPLIDQLTARKLYPLNLFPMAAGLLCFWLGQQTYWAFLYLAFSGMTMGLSMTISSALYAELYGTKELGSIRGITSSLVVISTAAAPVLLGALMDAGVPVSRLFGGMFVFVVLGILAAYKACSVTPSKTA